MARTRSVTVAAIFAAALVAGCGSSGKTTNTTTTSAHSATTSAQNSYAPAANTAATGSAGVVVTSKASKLGTIVAAGPKRLTVYLFEGDKAAGSSCSGACASVWPPVTTTGKPQAAGGALAAHLGTITRSNGTTQITYNGHPLYFYAKDGDAGDAYGQGINGFGASWYVLSPSGSKVDTS